MNGVSTDRGCLLGVLFDKTTCDQKNKALEEDQHALHIYHFNEDWRPLTWLENYGH